MKEQYLQTKLIQTLTKEGFLYIKTIQAKFEAFGKECNGVSDILAISPNGNLLAIECKSSTGKPTIEQTAFLCKVSLAGHCGIIHSPEHTMFKEINKDFQKNKCVNSLTIHISKSTKETDPYKILLDHNGITMWFNGMSNLHKARQRQFIERGINVKK